MGRWNFVLLLGTSLSAAMAVGAPQASQNPANQSPAGQSQPDATDVQKADVAFRAGYAAMQSGNLEEARRDFAEAVKQAPNLPEARVALAIILVQLNQPDQAIPQLQQALQLKPADPGILTNLVAAHEADARKLDGEGKQADAEAELHTALDTQAEIGRSGQATDASRTVELEDELGSVQAQEKHWSDAEAAFRTALRVLPSTGSEAARAAGPHMHLGVVLLEEKRYPEALQELQAAADSAPESPMAQFELGRGLAAAGRDEDAVIQLQEALRRTPDGKGAQVPGAALELAMAEQRLGKEDDAIPHFRTAVEQEPHNAVALTNLGLALTQTGKAVDAIPFYKRAVAEAPADPVVLQDLGVAELQQSHFDEAIVQFEAALKLDTSNPQLHYDLGLAYKLKDRMDDAVRELSEARRLDASLPDPPYTLGILYMQMGKLDEAVTQLRAALAVRPDNGDGWAILGSTLKQAGKQVEAEEALRKAIDLLPNQPGPHITLAGVLSEEGKKDEATEQRKIAAGLSRTAVNRQRAAFSTNAGNQLLLRGEVEGAVGRYQEAIAADPSYPEAHAQLAIAYERQGRAADAAAEHAKAEEIRKKVSQ